MAQQREDVSAGVDGFGTRRFAGPIPPQLRRGSQRRRDAVYTATLRRVKLRVQVGGRADAVQSLALPMDFRFQSDRFGWRVEAGESQPEVARVAAEALQLLPHEALGALPLRRVHDVRGGEVPRRADEQVRPAALEQRLRRRW